jgi:hypothetical protein
VAFLAVILLVVIANKRIDKVIPRTDSSLFIDLILVRIPLKDCVGHPILNWIACADHIRRLYLSIFKLIRMESRQATRYNDQVSVYLQG